MRKGLLYFALIAFAFAGCKNDDGTLFPVKMSATVNGASWSALTRVTTRYADKFIISGTSLNSDILVLTVLGSTPGTYSFAVDSLQTKCTAIYKKNSNNDSTYIASSGEVILTEVNTTEKTISGTFHFNMRHSQQLLSTMSISDGEFSGLKYTESSQE